MILTTEQKLGAMVDEKNYWKLRYELLQKYGGVKLQKIKKFVADVKVCHGQMIYAEVNELNEIINNEEI